MWLTPKTNWATGDYFNVADVNRIEGNIAYLNEQLGPLDYHASIATKTNWQVYEMYASTDFLKNCVNLEKIKNGFVAISNWPVLPSTIGILDANTLNAVESATQQLKAALEGLQDAITYSGTIYAQ